MNKPNLSQVNDKQTARTNGNSAKQRAENLAIFGSKKILELCVGPSLQTIQDSYRAFGMDVVGNDIDSRWQRFYPNGKWIIEDALKVDLRNSFFDTVVFAPPLSVNCTGRRKDSLSIDQVNPKYESFLDKLQKESYSGLAVLVLPARSLSTNQDRNQFHRLVNRIQRMGFTVESCHLTNGRREIRKYIDLYIKRI